eukprot:TRINITY_DN13212_c0_g1_i1.p1 TRINITY_DN13212_c0_g1~~TRINITY_DN13212_c0_g1_i1.p1  ORF type:complete len:500 (+),score=89.99 TRINITY_DN13212_c0_g1_i1:187-1686(+)
MGNCQASPEKGQQQRPSAHVSKRSKVVAAVSGDSSPKPPSPLCAGFKKEYDLMDRLGEGEFGSVYRCLHRPTGSRRAAKVVRKGAHPQMRVQLKSESFAGRLLPHENLCQQYDFFDSDATAVIVYELCSGGEVGYSLCGRTKYTEATVVIVTKGVVRALAHLHRHNLAHLDVKPQNIMFARPPEADAPISVADVKLTDYGCLTPFQPGSPSMSTAAGTPHFAAPEVIAVVCSQCARGIGPVGVVAPTVPGSSRAALFDERADVYSACVVAYILMVGSHPLVPVERVGSDTMPAFFARSLAGEVCKPPAFRSLSLEAQELLLLGLSTDFGKRPRAAELLECAWLKSSGEVEDTPESSLSSSRTQVQSPDLIAISPRKSRPLTVARSPIPECSSGQLLTQVSHSMLSRQDVVKKMSRTLLVTRAGEDLRYIGSSQSGVRADLEEALSHPGQLLKSLSEAAVGAWRQAARSPADLPNIKAVPEVLSEVASQDTAPNSPVYLE